MTLAVYIHWPFCVSKCPYCDFNSHVGDTQNQQVWRGAYRRELEHYAALLPDRRVTSVFFGGGTPSLMEAQTVEAVLNDIARLWRLDEQVEITLEANPSSAEAGKFADFRQAGINRLSLGVQSLEEEALKFLKRAHGVQEARDAIALAARYFPRFSFDLIYARQGQTPEAWRRELREALTLAGDHLSLYQLTIEPHTQFDTRARKGESLTAPDDHAIEMFETTQEIMELVGMPAYEISNHARKGQESRHNLTYWHYQDYIGIGPGAHGRFRIQGYNTNHTMNSLTGVVGIRAKRRGGGLCRRTANELNVIPKRVNSLAAWYDGGATENHTAPAIWLQEAERQGHGIKNRENLSPDTAMREAVMMGLRLSEGIDLADWAKKFPTPLTQFLPKDRLIRLQKEGYIAVEEKTLRATRTGRQRLNAILGYLLASMP